jgi:hypothetical protein
VIAGRDVLFPKQASRHAIHLWHSSNNKSNPKHIPLLLHTPSIQTRSLQSNWTRSKHPTTTTIYIRYSSTTTKYRNEYVWRIWREYQSGSYRWIWTEYSATRRRRRGRILWTEHDSAKRWIRSDDRRVWTEYYRSRWIWTEYRGWRGTRNVRTETGRILWTTAAAAATATTAAESKFLRWRISESTATTSTTATVLLWRAHIRGVSAGWRVYICSIKYRSRRKLASIFSTTAATTSVFQILGVMLISRQQQPQITTITRWSDLPESDQNFLESLEKYITEQKAICEDLKTRSPQLEEYVSSVPTDVTEVQKRFDTISHILAVDTTILTNDLKQRVTLGIPQLLLISSLIYYPHKLNKQFDY